MNNEIQYNLQHHQRLGVSIIKNLFDEHEIRYFIPEEITNNASRLAFFGMSGIRVQVLEHQKDKAIALLKERGFS